MLCLQTLCFCYRICYKMPPPTSQISRFTVRVIVTMDTLYLRRAVPRYTNSFLLCSSLKWIAVVLFSLTNQIPQTR